MEDYIATFFSHFGAMAFKKKCDKEGYPAVIMPVPRNLSSSCGTCVKFTGTAEKARNWNSDELEQLAQVLENGTFQVIWHSYKKEKQRALYHLLQSDRKAALLCGLWVYLHIYIKFARMETNETKSERRCIFERNREIQL